MNPPEVFPPELFGDAVLVLPEHAHQPVAWASTQARMRWPELVQAPRAAWEARFPALADLWAAAEAQGSLSIAGAGTVERYELQYVRRERGWWTRWHDLAERERLLQRHLEDREKLLFTSRAISIGEMASTLAHELNQPIGTIVNLLRGVRMRLPSGDTDDALAKALERAGEQALFASRVIARIREYTHSRKPRKDRVDLGTLLAGSLSLLDWEIQRDGVCATLDVPPEPMWVLADAVMLEQVFVNLLRNALDAMRGCPDRRLRVQANADAEQVSAAVGDSGGGIDGEAEQRLFVPFASSKPSGMGIGLNICRSFIELHQGRLWFTRNPQAGCTFHVALPPAPARARIAVTREGEAA